MIKCVLNVLNLKWYLPYAKDNNQEDSSLLLSNLMISLLYQEIVIKNVNPVMVQAQTVPFVKLTNLDPKKFLNVYAYPDIMMILGF